MVDTNIGIATDSQWKSHNFLHFGMDCWRTDQHLMSRIMAVACWADTRTRTMIFRCSCKCHHFGTDSVHRYQLCRFVECILLDRSRFLYTYVDKGRSHRISQCCNEPMDDNSHTRHGRYCDHTSYRHQRIPLGNCHNAMNPTIEEFPEINTANCSIWR